MGDRIHAVGRLTTLPIAIGVVVGAIFHHLGLRCVAHDRRRGGHRRPRDHHHLCPAHALLAQAGQ